MAKNKCPDVIGKLNSYPLGLCYGGIVDFADKVGAVKFYTSMMLNRTQSMFKYDGLPESIPQKYLELLLQTEGSVCITKVDTDKGGNQLYAIKGAFGDIPDAYYVPTHYIVANPYLKFNKSLEIGKDCIVIGNDSLFIGLLPLFNRYATLLAENDISIRTADIQARIMAMVEAKDDKSKASAQEFFRDIELGKLGAVGSKQFLDGIRVNPYGGNSDGLITQLIELQQYLKAGWYNELGLNANYNMKREAINSEEAQLNYDALLPLVDDMLRSRQMALEKVNAMFGTNITVSLNSTWRIKREEVEETNSDDSIDDTEDNDPENNEGENDEA